MKEGTFVATISITGNIFSGCVIGRGSFAEIGDAFSKARESAGNLSAAIGKLKTKIDIASIGTNIETSQEMVQTVQECEENKKGALSNAYQKLEKLIQDVGSVDFKVASKIRERKLDFYARYNYLEPDIERQRREEREKRNRSLKEKAIDMVVGAYEWAADKVDKVCTFCKEHWKEIVTVVVAIVVVVVCVVLTVVTGGIASAIFAGIAFGVGGQLISDVATSFMTGEFRVSSWQEYVGAGVGGAIGGAIGFAIGPEGAGIVGKFAADMIGNVINSGASTIVGQTLSNVTGGEYHSAGEIAANTIFNMGISALFTAGSEGLTKVANTIGNKFDVTFLRRLGDGFGSYTYAFDTQMKKLNGGFTKNISWKTVRNGAMWILQELDIPENIFRGTLKAYDIDEPKKIVNHIKERMVIPPVKIDIDIRIDFNINVNIRNNAVVAV